MDGATGQPPLRQPQLGMPLAMCMKLIENKVAYEKPPEADEATGVRSSSLLLFFYDFLHIYN